ncbi:hypothetical protein GOP47_0016949 [Adiantum capillus-veneris]|uniref:Glycosyltransferase n=1 Tax=Adiantum capillus-veneris TaxID=13818 RepID=A0A9D4ZB64_ADICA|nr:hypothetical protein GOP47_0016949 [Adiantum capillus-veneris]
MEDTKCRQHHALAVPLPGQGHINPLMRLCKRLAAEHDFTITFLDIHRHHEEAAAAESSPAAHQEPSSAPAAAAHDVEFSPPDPAQKLDIRRARLSLYLPPPSSPAARLEGLFEGVQTLAPQIEQLLLRLQQQHPPITCLISDLFVTAATQHLADKLQLPRVALIPCSHSIILHFHHLLEGGFSLEEVMKVSIQRELLRENVFKEGLQGLPTLKVDDLMENFGGDFFMYTFTCKALEETKNKAHAFVVNSFEEIEGNALKVNMKAPLYAVGPLVEPLEKEASTSLLEEDDTCLLWLDQQPCSSVLFISFGSIASISLAQFEELVAGLLSSRQRFLWVFRSNLINDVVFTTFPEQLLSESCGRGYVVSWAPQVKVLSHCSIHGFLTHCGWNSTLEAISRGIPMICFPYFADQFMDAKLIVQEWKVGLRLRKSKESGLVDREEVERAIRALMDEKEGQILHKNALVLKQVCDQNYLSGGYAFKNLQALVQSLN